jgi:hypothetical protein
VLPDPFPRVEVRGLGRERLQVHRPGCPFGHNRAHVPLVHGRAVPDHQPFLRYRRQSGLEEDHALQAVQCGITPQGIGLCCKNSPKRVCPSKHLSYAATPNT